MGAGFGFGKTDPARRRVEPFERDLRDSGHGDGRRNDGRQRGDAADAGFEANVAVAVVRAGCGVSLAKAVANYTGGSDRVGRGLRGAKAYDQAGERNRVSPGERDHVLPQRPPRKWPPREYLAHDRSPTPHRSLTA